MLDEAFWHSGWIDPEWNLILLKKSHISDVTSLFFTGVVQVQVPEKWQMFLEEIPAAQWIISGSSGNGETSFPWDIGVGNIASGKTLYKFNSSICGRFPVYIYIYIIGILVETRTFHSPYSGDSPRLPLHFPQKCGPFDSPTVEKLSSARFFELDQFLLHRSQWNRPKLFGLGKLFLSLNHLRWLIIYPILIHAVVGSLTMENQHLQLGHFHFP